MDFGLPNQTLERTGLSLWVGPWSFGSARVRTPVAQLGRSAISRVMRTFAVLILSCASLFAADTDVRVVTSTTTNVESASVTTTDVFTRAGRTNLVRQTSTKAGEVRVRVHWFYRDGERLATFVVTPDHSAFVPEAGARYSVSLEFGPSKGVRYASISKNDGFILDAFTCTNGIFCPDGISHITQLNAKFEKAIGESTEKR